ncbi:hypothetical protein NP233_g8929 [Leucocoprinus birnbaumii]|uniref:Uncharacterized protein n=1 Tax=Leucocoprinus birnbaumii TaxID=56174 RepID=A0AAD5VQ00_9AGAR|nr:hypothetical protein NP233_g8929 [Leucocoprinus birnbaumii]
MANPAQSLDFTPLPVTLASLPVESFLYGVFLLLFILSSILFVYRYARQNQLQSKSTTPGAAIRPVLVLSILIFFAITGHWVVAWLYLFSSTLQTPIADARILFSYEAVKSIFVVSSVLLADTAFKTTHITMDFNKPSSQKVFDSWMLADITFTICTNVYCTAFISWKIWSVTRQLESGGSRSSLQRVLSTVIESAAFYTTWMATAFGLSIGRSQIENIFIDANPAVAGITFMLINVRVGLGWAATQSLTWRDALQESQFKATRGEMRFALTQLTPESSMLQGVSSGVRSSISSVESGKHGKASEV